MFQKGGIQQTPERFFWRKEEGDWERFRAWVNGETGFPIVDAWMTELKETGFVSNRGRQNVASFLCHTLGFDWRWGAEYFEQVLLDHDPASNYGNWQTIAGVGFQERANVFNIVKQSRQYEKDGTYQRAWLPELSLLCAKHPESLPILVHTPWEVREASVRAELPNHYLHPIVNPKTAFFYESETTRNSGGGKGKAGGGKYKGSWKPNGFHGSEYHEGGGSRGSHEDREEDGGANIRGPSKKKNKWRKKE